MQPAPFLPPPPVLAPLPTAVSAFPSPEQWAQQAWPSVTSLLPPLPPPPPVEQWLNPEPWSAKQGVSSGALSNGFSLPLSTPPLPTPPLPTPPLPTPTVPTAPANPLLVSFPTNLSQLPPPSSTPLQSPTLATGSLPASVATGTAGKPLRALLPEEAQNLRSYYAQGLTPIAWTGKNKLLSRLSVNPTLSQWNGGFFLGAWPVFDVMNNIVKMMMAHKLVGNALKFELVKETPQLKLLRFGLSGAVGLVGGWLTGKACKKAALNRNAALEVAIRSHAPGTTWGQLKQEPGFTLNTFRHHDKLDKFLNENNPEPFTFLNT